MIVLTSQVQTRNCREHDYHSKCPDDIFASLQEQHCKDEDLFLTKTPIDRLESTAPSKPQLRMLHRTKIPSSSSTCQGIHIFVDVFAKATLDRASVQHHCASSTVQRQHQAHLISAKSEQLSTKDPPAERDEPDDTGLPMTSTSRLWITKLRPLALQDHRFPSSRDVEQTGRMDIWGRSWTRWWRTNLHHANPCRMG